MSVERSRRWSRTCCLSARAKCSMSMADFICGGSSVYAFKTRFSPYRPEALAQGRPALRFVRGQNPERRKILEARERHARFYGAGQVYFAWLDGMDPGF